MTTRGHKKIPNKQQKKKRKNERKKNDTKPTSKSEKGTQMRKIQSSKSPNALIALHHSNLPERECNYDQNQEKNLIKY